MTKKTYSYKGYYGSVENDLEGLVLHGRILHVSDLITYESDSLSGLKKEFEAAVDDYLETCVSLGKHPDKPYTGSFNIRTTPDLHREAAVYAANNGKTLNLVVNEAIRAKLNPKVDELRVNHDHNVHHDHNIKLDVTSSSTSDFDLKTSEDLWQLVTKPKEASQKQH